VSEIERAYETSDQRLARWLVTRRAEKDQVAKLLAESASAPSSEDMDVGALSPTEREVVRALRSGRWRPLPHRTGPA
jgi:hypothetical protein